MRHDAPEILPETAKFNEIHYFLMSWFSAITESILFICHFLPFGDSRNAIVVGEIFGSLIAEIQIIDNYQGYIENRRI